MRATPPFEESEKRLQPLHMVVWLIYDQFLAIARLSEDGADFEGTSRVYEIECSSEGLI